MRKTKSLEDVHEQVDPSMATSKWKKILAFFGPAYLVSVGYMDPGNWATDIAGGSAFGYGLLWVLLMSNLMAILLQSLSARLGIVQGRDLAQCSRAVYPPAVNFTLYILAEIAIAACDLAEVLGMAIGLKLLLGLPLIWGVMATVLDTFLLLYLQRLGMRKLEAFIIALIAIIGVSFFIEVFFAKPDMGSVVKGFIPVIKNSTALYLAIGIIGATVMPHNLYLHSALVQTRKIKRDDGAIKKAIRLNMWDSTIALNVAFFVNAAILVLAGAIFYTSGHYNIASLEDAHKLLTPLLGSKVAPVLFAIALIASGQSSTVTGTLAGQIIMEGYLRLRINPAMRRLITRMIAIIPTLLVLLIAGESKVTDLLLFSQVLLSMQLAFAVIPLIHFVSDKKKMGTFAISLKTKIASWVVAALIIVLNMKLFSENLISWYNSSGSAVRVLLIFLSLAIVALLLITIIYPLILRRKESNVSVHNDISPVLTEKYATNAFTSIALALDYSANDNQIMRYALQLGSPSTHFVLIHVVESAPARMIGDKAHDYETRNDQEQLEHYVSLLTARGYKAKGILGFKSRTGEIARIVKENNCDLLIIGSHGHNTAKDWLYGETINTVRHMISIPVFIAR